MTADRGGVTLGELETLAEFALDQGGALAQVGCRLMFGLARFRNGQRLGVTLEAALGLAPGPVGSVAQRQVRQVAMLREVAAMLGGSARRRAREIASEIGAAARHRSRPRADATAFANLCAEIAQLGLKLPCAETIRKIIAVG